MQGAVTVETYSKGVVESLYDGEDFGGLALIHNVPRYARDSGVGFRRFS